MESCAIKVDIIIINSATEPDCVGAFPSSPTLPQEKKKILYTEAETSSTVHRGCEEFYSTQKLWGVILYTETETCSTVHRSWDILYCTQKLRGTLVHRSCEFYCTQKLWGALLYTEAVSSTVHRSCEEFYWTQKLWQVPLYTDAETGSAVHICWDKFSCTQTLRQIFTVRQWMRMTTDGALEFHPGSRLPLDRARSHTACHV